MLRNCLLIYQDKFFAFDITPYKHIIVLTKVSGKPWHVSCNAYYGYKKRNWL